MLACITTWPMRCGQWPAWRVTSSTGPPGVARPANVSGGRTPTCPSGVEPLAVTFASSKGPAAAVDPLKAGGRGQLRWRRARAVDRCDQMRAALLGEGVIERGMGVHDESQAEDRGGGRDDQHESDDDRLDPPAAADPAARGASYRTGAHRRTSFDPAAENGSSDSAAIRPSRICTARWV